MLKAESVVHLWIYINNSSICKNHMVNPIKFGQKMLGLTPSWSENVRIKHRVWDLYHEIQPWVYKKKHEVYVRSNLKKIYMVKLDVDANQKGTTFPANKTITLP